MKMKGKNKMRKNTAGYAINHITQTIELTKSFMKNAKVRGTQEYAELCSLKMELPDYRFVEKTIARNPSKQTYKGLSYDNMECYIQAIDPQNASRKLGEFQSIIELSKAQSASYAYVKKWFLANYPNYQSIPENVLPFCPADEHKTA